MYKYISLVRNHTLSQIWNVIKYKVSSRITTHSIFHPIQLVMFITSRCNLKCLFCPRKAPSVPIDYFKFNDMSFRNFVKIVDKFSRAVSLYLSGGEPFLNNDVFSMIEYAHLKKMHVSMSTNGILLQDKIDKIMCSPLSTINISLNSTNSSDYKKIHGVPKSFFNTVLENIIDLVEEREKVKNNLKMEVSYVCTKSNYTKIPDMVRLAEELKVDELVFNNLIPFGLPHFLREQCLYDDDCGVVEVIESVEEPNSKLRVIMPRLYSRKIIKRLCRMPFTAMPINGDGDVSVCCPVTGKKEYIGNIWSNDDVWNNIYYQKMRKILTDNSEPLPDLCKTCPQMSRPYKVLQGKENNNWNR